MFLWKQDRKNAKHYAKTGKRHPKRSYKNSPDKVRCFCEKCLCCAARFSQSKVLFPAPVLTFCQKLRAIPDVSSYHCKQIEKTSKLLVKHEKSTGLQVLQPTKKLKHYRNAPQLFAIELSSHAPAGLTNVYYTWSKDQS